jgi:hypothetical protein
MLVQHAEEEKKDESGHRPALHDTRLSSLMVQNKRKIPVQEPEHHDTSTEK